MLGRPALGAPPSVACDELRRLQLLKQDVTLVDVRLPSDYALGHIQGSRNVPAEGIAGAELPREGNLVLYCGDNSCPLSAAAADRLMSMGYSNVRVLDGGLSEWRRKGYPVEQTDPAALAGPRAAKLGAGEARKRIKAGTLYVLDARPALEFSSGHLPRARNLPLEESLPADLPKDRDILVYDNSAERSGKAASRLIEAGYRVVELQGGIAGWARKKYPLEVK